MARSVLVRALFGVLLPLAAMAVQAGGTTVHAPEADPGFRALRSDYVRTWYVFNDSQLDGVLNPGDTRIGQLKNWWTPVSAHTQHNYDDGPYANNTYFRQSNAADDMASGPMNFASQKFNYTADPNGDNNANYNYWLPMEANTMAFYMTYSQFDNNYFDTWTSDPLEKLRNTERNGWAFGWVTNTVVKNGGGEPTQDQTPVGGSKMDIYVHKGAGTFDVNFNGGVGVDGGVGQSISNPNVAMSNDISNLAKFGTGENCQWHPPTFDEATQTYNSALTANEAYIAALGLTPTQYNTIVSSMEVKEWDPNNIQTQVPGGVIFNGRTPSAIASTITTPDGAYLYEDVFTDRCSVVKGTTDGGVIAGLTGWDNYQYYQNGNNNWWDQQVIRIDVSEEMLKSDSSLTGFIEKIYFYDFGTLGFGSSTDPQINPRRIVFYVDPDPTLTLAHGRIYYYDWSTSTAIYFPENRIYIAQVDIAPEPATAAVLIFGGAFGLLAHRRRRKVSRAGPAGLN